MAGQRIRRPGNMSLSPPRIEARQMFVTARTISLDKLTLHGTEVLQRYCVELQRWRPCRCSFFPLDADDLEALLRNADVAMNYAIDCGCNNYQFFSPELNVNTRRDERRRAKIEQRLTSLTPREREVLDLLVAGRSNKMVAYPLGTSTRTIENHRARIMDKMEADSLPELVRMSLHPSVPIPSTPGSSSGRPCGTDA